MPEGRPGPAGAAPGLTPHPELIASLQAEIARRGALPFSRYMEQALYHPEWGYYGSGRGPGREEADFWTAPEMSPAFGRLVGRQVQEMHRRLESPQRFAVIEYGAGTGSLAAALLDDWAGQRLHLYRPGSYLIVERSSALRQRQQEALARHGEVVAWADPCALPADSAPDGVVLMNEVLDALAVDRLVGGPDGPMEIRVGFRDGRLAEERLPASPELIRRLQDWLPDGVPALPEGHEVELAPGLGALLADAAARIGRGYLLVIDYGFHAAERLRPERRRGTLMAYHEHQAIEDPLAAPGRSDLTAHADWTALDREAAALGFADRALTTQMRFLLALGLGDEIEALERESLPASERTRRRLALTALIRPGGMGEMFKVWVGARGATLDLAGLQDPFAALS